MEYEIDTDPGRLNTSFIHEFLSGSTHWASGIPEVDFLTSLERSICFGAYARKGKQLGFARAVSDKVTFAWICDIFVASDFRGRGIGNSLVQAAIHHPEVAGVRRILLATSTAHSLYSNSGFELVPEQTYMEITREPTTLWPR